MAGIATGSGWLISTVSQCILWMRYQELGNKLHSCHTYDDRTTTTDRVPIPVRFMIAPRHLDAPTMGLWVGCAICDDIIFPDPIERVSVPIILNPRRGRSFMIPSIMGLRASP